MGIREYLKQDAQKEKRKCISINTILILIDGSCCYNLYD